MRRILLGVLLSLVVTLIACEKKSINQIMADPGRYANREVGIEGSVVQSYSVLGHGAYEVEDGTGRLWVVTDKGVPRTGARVAAKGTIRDGFDLGTLIKLPDQFRSGLVMIETSHKASY